MGISGNAASLNATADGVQVTKAGSSCGSPQRSSEQGDSGASSPETRLDGSAEPGGSADDLCT